MSAFGSVYASLLSSVLSCGQCIFLLLPVGNSSVAKSQHRTGQHACAFSFVCVVCFVVCAVCVATLGSCPFLCSCLLSHLCCFRVLLAPVFEVRHNVVACVVMFMYPVTIRPKSCARD